MGRRLTHVDHRGRARMVDVGEKPVSRRLARAEGFIRLSPEALRAVRANQIKKGDVLTLAQVAGIQAAKQTAILIPLCHPLPLEVVEVEMKLEKNGVRALSRVHCTAKTGAEMEAITAVTVALLTVYDMCKAVDKNMRLEGIHLVEKKKQTLESER